MGSPPDVEAPDYGKANQEAVYSDFATLPDRARIEQASRFGDVVTYQDPRTGETKTADFRGGFDADKFFKDNPEAKAGWLEEQRNNGYDRGDGTILKARDPQTFVEQWLQWSGRDPSEMDTYRRAGGDLAYAQQAANLAVETNDRVQRGQLDLRQELVTDPETGKKLTRGEMAALQTAREIRGADPLAYQARQDLTQKVMNDLNTPAERVAADESFGKLADQTAGINAPGKDARFGSLFDEAKTQLSMPRDRTGEIDAATRLQGRSAFDPVLMKYASEVDRLTPTGGDVRLGDIYSRASGRGNGRLGELASEADRRLTGEVNDPSNAALNMGLQQAVDEYKLGGQLDPETKNQIMQDVRASQAARGNVLGDSATLVEAMELGKAAEARKAQRLQQLLDVQGKAFGQNQSLRDEERSAVAQRLGTLQNLDTTAFDRSMSNDELLAQLQGQDFGQKQSQAATRLGAVGDVAGRVTDNTRYNDSARRDDVNQRFGLLQGADISNLNAAASRFGLLSGLVSSDVAQDQQNFQNNLTKIGTEATLRGQQVNENRTTRNENYGREQQKLANASSFILGQPITNQFGSLASAQQGSVGFNNIGYKSGPGTADPSTAAGQIYGSQSQIYQQNQQLKADNQNQWMQLAGSAAGAAAGMMM